jgi:hypothetical protein
MLKLGDSIKGEKSFGVMNYEPPYTRPAWPVLSKVEGYSGVRGAVAVIKPSPIHSIGNWAYTVCLSIIKFFFNYLFAYCFL